MAEELKPWEKAAQQEQKPWEKAAQGPAPTPLSALPGPQNAPAPPGPGLLESGVNAGAGVVNAMAHPTAGGVGATLAVAVGGAATGGLGWLGALGLAGLGGTVGEGVGQLSDLSATLEAEKALIAEQQGKSPASPGIPLPRPGAIPETKDIYKRMAAEGATQAAFQGVAGGVGKLLKGGVGATRSITEVAAENSAAGRAFMAAERSKAHEARVIGAQTQLSALNESADKALEAMKGLEGQEFRVERAKTAQYLLKDSFDRTRDGLAMAANAAAKGVHVDMVGESKALLRDVAEFLPERNRVMATELQENVRKVAGGAKIGLKKEPSIAATGVEQAAQQASSVPLDALMDARSNVKKAIDVGGMNDASRGVLRRHLERLDKVIENSFAELGDPGRAEAWKLYKSFYSSERTYAEMAALKLRDVSPAKLADTIDNNPASVRLIRAMAKTGKGANAELLDDVRSSFMDGIIKGKDGSIKLEGINAKLKGYGESVGELFKDDPGSLARWKEMGRQAEKLLQQAAEKPGIPPPTNLMQRAWELATSKAVSNVAGTAYGGVKGYMAGGPMGAMLGSAAGGAAGAAAQALPELVLQRIAKDPKAYEKWLSGWSTAGRIPETAVEILASVIRTKYPEALGPIRAGANRAAGAPPAPRPLPAPR